MGDAATTTVVTGQNIMEIVGSWVSGLGSVIQSLFTTLTSIFANGQGITLIGTLCIGGFGIRLVFKGLKKLFGLFRI